MTSSARRRSALVWLFLVVLNAAAGAASGDLDPSFASGGKYLSTLYGTTMFGPSVAVQPGGRIVVAGKHFNGSDDDFAMLSLTAAGAFEGSAIVPFGSGKNEDAKSVLLLGDGRFVIGGEGNAGTYAQHGLVRFLANGSIDATFGNGGKVAIDFGRLSHLHGIAKQTDGKLVVIGDSYSGANTGRVAMARLNVNGSLDTSFGAGGKVEASYGESSNGHAAVIGADGRITIGGYVENATNGLASACFVARFTTSGQADTTFGSGGSNVATLGTGTTNYCHQLVMQTDGKVVIAGGTLRNHIGDFVMARYTTTGAFDSSFGSGGVVSTEFGGRVPSSSEEASAIVLQPDGKLMLGGYTEGKFAVARYTTAGALDTSFGTGGKTSFAFGTGVDDQIKSIALQPDRKIVAVGYTRAGANYQLAVARLLNDSGAALPDADRLFNYAEAVLPDYFSPGTAATQLVSGYTARVYANGMAVGVKDGRVYVYGDVYGGLKDVGSLASFLPQVFQAGY